jgi:hypothetical protein
VGEGVNMYFGPEFKSLHEQINGGKEEEEIKWIGE